MDIIYNAKYKRSGKVFAFWHKIKDIKGDTIYHVTRGRLNVTSAVRVILHVDGRSREFPQGDYRFEWSKEREMAQMQDHKNDGGK